MSEDELPEGWVAAPLGEVADVQLGKMLDREKRIKGRHLPYLRNASVRWGTFNLSDLLTMPFENDELERYSVQPGDLLICEGGEPGRAAVWEGGPGDVKYQKAILRVRPGQAISDPKWIMYSLQRDALSGDLEQYFTGSTIKHFPRQAVLKYEIRIPPLAEQKRIVAKVEELMAGVNAARERLARVPTILKRFRQAVLAAACEGRLTEEWRGAKATPSRADGEEAEPAPEAELPESWRWLTAGSLCDAARALTYGVIKLGPPVARGIPTLRSSNVRPMFIDATDVKCISREIASNYSRTTLRGGEVLITVRGTLGGIAVAKPEMAGWNVSREVAVLPALPGRCDPNYLVIAIASRVCQSWLMERAKGVAYTGINIEDLKLLPIPTAPQAEQLEIVRRVEALFKLADTIEKRVTAATARVEKLTQAILAKAFRGELVPTEAELARRGGREYQSAEALPRSRGYRSQS